MAIPSLTMRMGVSCFNASSVTQSKLWAGATHTVGSTRMPGFSTASSARSSNATQRRSALKWVDVATDFPYGHTYGLRHLQGQRQPLSEEEAATRAADLRDRAARRAWMSGGPDQVSRFM